MQRHRLLDIAVIMGITAQLGRGDRRLIEHGERCVTIAHGGSILCGRDWLLRKGGRPAFGACRVAAKDRLAADSRLVDRTRHALAPASGGVLEGAATTTVS